MLRIVCLQLVSPPKEGYRIDMETDDNMNPIQPVFSVVVFEIFNFFTFIIIDFVCCKYKLFCKKNKLVWNKFR